MPPPTPLLPGRPTLKAKSPDASEMSSAEVLGHSAAREALSCKAHERWTSGLIHASARPQMGVSRTARRECTARRMCRKAVSSGANLPPASVAMEFSFSNRPSMHDEGHAFRAISPAVLYSALIPEPVMQQAG